MTLESAFTMADDSMEISSEHGHNDGDGDIDIDFDFTSAPADEDYVLEDAALTADFGDDLRPQPSPAINDDLMLDGDVDSYQMDDADLLHGEEGQTIDAEDSLHLGEDPNHGFQFAEDNGATDHLYAPPGSSEIQLAESDASEAIQEDLQAAEVISIPQTEKPSADVAQHHSPTASPVQESPRSAVSAQDPKSPPASDPDRGPISLDHTSERHDTNVTSPSISGDGSKAVETTSLDSAALPISPQEVMVVYQSVEYALFSSSELDDPDSFFLSDTTIAEKPLADLFNAIRQVIQEDLSDEDELCMAVEDLGIETDEVSCAQAVTAHPRLTPVQQSSALLRDVTLTQILKLRENLLRNDGVESSRPLCIVLGTRVNFLKRIGKLTEGAAEGKGLSQFVTWDEQSESLDDLDEANESKTGVEPTFDTQELQTVPDEQGADAHDATHGMENSVGKERAEEEEYKHEDESRPESTEDSKLASTDSVSGHGFPQHSTGTNASSSNLQNDNGNGSPPEEYYDEDDLIDYSEEEGDSVPAVQRHVKSQSNDENRTNQGIFNLFLPCLKPNTCFCSKCSALLLAEYEAVNEDLRRPSLSRTNEDNIPEQSDEQAPPATGVDHERAYAEENGTEYETKNEDHDEFHNGELGSGYEDFTTAEFDATGSLDQFDGTSLTADEFGGEGQFADGTFGDSFDVFGAGAQEYNYGDDSTFGDDNGIQQNEDGVDGPEITDFTEDKPEQLDTAESSVTVDADEIQYEDQDGANDLVLDNSKPAVEHHETEHSVEVEHEDEIDYEDEDEVGKEKDSEATTPLTGAPILSSSTGKRSREDVESDDAMSMGGKGTCWPLTPKRRRS